MVSGWATDALWVAPHICERLRSEVTDLRAVYMADELDAEAKEPPQVPAAIVLLNDLRPPETNPLQRAALVEQDWLVMLAVRSLRKDKDRSRQALGLLVTQTVRALQGWVPAGSKRAFTWRRGPRPDYGVNTNFFPLLFSIDVVAT